MHLPPLVQTFVLHFGEMGSRWGINRTVGQIYALLFVAQRPLNADEIAERWRLALQRQHGPEGAAGLEPGAHFPPAGDRRDYFAAPAGLWEIFRAMVEERKKREIDPTLSSCASS